jgi:hypothetical protein
MTRWWTKPSRRTDLVSTWVLYLGGTLIWIVLVVPDRELSVYWWLFMATAAVLNLAAVARALRSSRDPRPDEERR